MGVPKPAVDDREMWAIGDVRLIHWRWLVA